MASHLPGIYATPLYKRGRQRKMRDNFHTAPGFRWLGSYYSCRQDPEVPWDPRVVAAIQRRDPGFVPMVVYSLYLSSADYASERLYRLKRHAAGRHVARPLTPKKLFYVAMPPGSRAPMPNQIDEIFHEGPRDPAGPFVRGGFHALDWSLAWEPMVSLTKQELRRLHIEDPDVRQAREDAALAEEEARAVREINRYFEKKVSQMSDVEIQQFIDRQAAGLPIRDRQAPVRVFHGPGSSPGGH